MILLGDFNSVTNSSDRLSGRLDSTSNQLDQLLWEWQVHEPGGTHLSCHTYHHPSLGSHKSHLDRIYMSQPDKWVGCAQPVLYSDHYVVFLFLPHSSDVGPKNWKFPEDLLGDSTFCSQIELVLGNFQPLSATESWESIKIKIQNIAQD